MEQVEAPVERNPLEVADVCSGRWFELLEAYGMGEWLETREKVAETIRGDVWSTDIKGGVHEG